MRKSLGFWLFASHRGGIQGVTPSDAVLASEVVHAVDTHVQGLGNLTISLSLALELSDLDRDCARILDNHREYCWAVEYSVL